MKYCKKCGVLYSSLLPQCPKCNTVVAEHAEQSEQDAPEAPQSEKIRQWIGIVIGVPALIFFLYFVISKLYAIS